MKLHRLVLKNYRGIEHREIDFPDHGVVVVSGANEIGKSSMVEALDLLLESRDRSTKKEVKQVKPTHADVGSEVTAEISTGPYRFVYHKRFHKKCETQLTVLEPRREQHSGDEAHDRVQAMLAETVDTELWRAQRVLQSASTDAVNLSGCDALTRALDVAAGDAAALSGTEPLLIDRIDTEYARYFTPTGRPTGEWTAAIKALEAANAEVEQCAAAVAEVDDRVQRHATLTVELAELAQRQQEASARQTAAQAAADAIAALAEQVREAELIAAAATATSTASTAAHTERERLRTETDSRTAAVAALEAEAREAAEAQAMARDVAVEADAVVEQANQLPCRRPAASRDSSARGRRAGPPRRDAAVGGQARENRCRAARPRRHRARAVDNRCDRRPARADRKGRRGRRASRRSTRVGVGDSRIRRGHRHRTRHRRPTGDAAGRRKLVDARQCRDRGRGSRHPDRTSHAGHVRARDSGAIRCGATGFGRWTGGGTGRRPGRGAQYRSAAPRTAERPRPAHRDPGRVVRRRRCRATALSVGGIALPARVFRRHHDRRGHCPRRTRRGRSGPRHSGRRLRDPPTRRGVGDEQADRGINAGNTSAGQAGHSTRRACGGR